MLKFLCIIAVVIFSCYGATIEVPASQNEGRIVGGTVTSISKHPHQISLRQKFCEECRFSHVCGGSIYSADIIVTAAHCVDDTVPSENVVIAGTENRNGGDGYIALVERIVIHEDYDDYITNNDIALIFLATPLPLNNVTMASIPLATSMPEAKEKAYVTGWGTTTEGGTASNVLLETEVNIVDSEECDVAYGGERITDAMLCAGVDGGGKDACQGDSGGPLIVQRQLVGIVSWGSGCARPDYPGVYTNVAHFDRWIKKTIDGEYGFL